MQRGISVRQKPETCDPPKRTSGLLSHHHHLRREAEASGNEVGARGGVGGGGDGFSRHRASASSPAYVSGSQAFVNDVMANQNGRQPMTNLPEDNERSLLSEPDVRGRCKGWMEARQQMEERSQVATNLHIMSRWREKKRLSRPSKRAATPVKIKRDPNEMPMRRNGAIGDVFKLVTRPICCFQNRQHHTTCITQVPLGGSVNPASKT